MTTSQRAQLLTEGLESEVVEGIQLSGYFSHIPNTVGEFNVTWGLVSQLVTENGDMWEESNTFTNEPLLVSMVKHCVILATRYSIDILDIFRTSYYQDKVAPAAFDIVCSWPGDNMPWENPLLETAVEEYVIPAIDEIKAVQEDLSSQGFI